MFVFERVKDSKVNIKVIGVGGGGCNALKHMVEKNIQVPTIAANTDAAVLQKSLADYQLQLGPELTKGFGAGGDPKIGKKAAEESLEEIQRILEKTDMVFIAAGMGGGTGTGAAPIIAEQAKRMGILTVSVVTTPFKFEGKTKMQIALEGIEQLSKHSHTIVVISNEKLKNVINEEVKITEAFQLVDEVIYNAVVSIIKIIDEKAMVNVDFADVKNILYKGGLALLGTGFSNSENAALEAARMAVENPLLEESSIKGSKGILVYFKCRDNLEMVKFQEALTFIKQESGEMSDEEDYLKWGLNIDSELEHDVEIYIVAAKGKTTGLPLPGKGEKEVESLYEPPYLKKRRRFEKK